MLDPKRVGPVPALLRASRVVKIDPVTATVHLENGETVEGDLVIGADGVHSVTRSAIPGGDVQPFCDGPNAKAAFRFLLERKIALQDPVTAPLVEELYVFKMWYGLDRRVVMYPTSDNQLLNFVCIHPVSETQVMESENDAWGAGGSVQRMLEIFKAFDPAVLSLIGKAEPGTLKVWKLLDMEVIPRWTFKRLALLGDAAHPFLPHQGQGGACAIEDAVSLSIMLPGDTRPEEIEERLMLYEKARMTRANKLQQITREAGTDLKEGQKLDIASKLAFCFSHDEFEHSEEAFRQYQEARQKAC